MSERCGTRGESHPTMPHLVEECAREPGHDGDHCSILHKTLAEAEAHHAAPEATQGEGTP